MDEEQIFLKIEESRKKYWYLYIVILLFVILFFYLYVFLGFTSEYNFILLGIGLILGIGIEIARLGNILYVMETGIRKEEGVFNKKYVDIDYADIFRITVNKNFGQRILDIGNLEFNSSKKNDSSLEIKNISNPLGVKSKIEEQMESVKGKKKKS